MGRRRKWLNKVKSVLGSGESKALETNDEASKSLRSYEQEPDMLVERTLDDTVVDIPWCILEQPYVVTPVVQNVVELDEVVRSDQIDHDENESGVWKGSKYHITPSFNSKDLAVGDEKAAAIMIQKAVRRYLAKRRLRGLRGWARMKVLVQGSCTKRQTMKTLQCMQTLSRVQSQIRARRIRMSDENQALQRQILQTHEKEMENMKLIIGDDWNDSTKSKEKLEASLQKRQEAAMRRERALSYAHSSQRKWRNGRKVASPVYMELINPHWGWSWLERWMDTRPWESTSAVQEPISQVSVGEISKAYYAHCERHPNTSSKPPPLLTPQRPSRIVSTRPPSKTPSSSQLNAATKLINSPRDSTGKDESKTICSVRTFKKQRRHSIATSSMTNMISPRTMASSEAHKARLQKSSSSSGTSYGRLETGSLRSSSGFGKKASPALNLSAVRRHSGPPIVDLSSTEKVSVRS